MILLDTTSKKLQAKIASAPTTNNLQVDTTYVDHTSTAFTPASNSTTISGNSDTDIVAVPGASTQRQVKYISVFNADTVTHALLIKKDISGTDTVLWNGSLLPNERLEYIDGIGFRTFDAYGNQKLTSALLLPQPGIRPAMGVDAANLTATKTCTSNSTFAGYMGRAENAFSSIVVRFRVTTAAATITWAECAVAWSPFPTIASGINLTRLGFIDTSAIINSTGQKTVTINVSGVVPGMDLWFLNGAQATTAMIVRGALADDLQSGFYQVRSATRPSTMSGGTGFTVEGATTAPMWFTWQGT